MRTDNYYANLERHQTTQDRAVRRRMMKEEQTQELRDQFAMAALTGLLAHHINHWEWKDYARGAYYAADAMLKARENNHE